MTLKELNKLIQLCRKTGVSTLKMGDVELQLGPAPFKSIRSEAKKVDFNSFDPGQVPEPLPWNKEYPQAGLTPPQLESIATDTLSPDELLFYSAGGNQ